MIVRGTKRILVGKRSAGLMCRLWGGKLRLKYRWKSWGGRFVEDTEKKVPADRSKKIFGWFQKSNFEIWRNFLRLILVSFLTGWVEAEVPTRKSVGRSDHMLIFCFRMEHLSYTIPTLNFKVKVISVICNYRIYPSSISLVNFHGIINPNQNYHSNQKKLDFSFSKKFYLRVHLPQIDFLCSLIQVKLPVGTVIRLGFWDPWKSLPKWDERFLRSVQNYFFEIAPDTKKILSGGDWNMRPVKNETKIKL